MKKILAILGHPNNESFNGALMSEYVRGATESGAEVKTVRLGDLKFDPVFHGKGGQELEPDLIESQKLITWADHIVFFYPTWWCTMPALMKGFFDRVLTTGFAFDYVEGKSMPLKLLTGKTGRAVVTMDEPPFYYRFVYWAAGHIIIRRAICGFCGIKCKSVISVGPVVDSTPEWRKKWLERIYLLGKSLN